MAAKRRGWGPEPGASDYFLLKSWLSGPEERCAGKEGSNSADPSPDWVSFPVFSCCLASWVWCAGYCQDFLAESEIERFDFLCHPRHVPYSIGASDPISMDNGCFSPSHQLSTAAILLVNAPHWISGVFLWLSGCGRHRKYRSSFSWL